MNVKVEYVVQALYLNNEWRRHPDEPNTFTNINDVLERWRELIALGLIPQYNRIVVITEDIVDINNIIRLVENPDTKEQRKIMV